MQLGTSKRSRADYHHISDVRPGDFLFLCSDGVLENITDADLLRIVSSDNTDSEKIAAIKGLCVDRTYDNHTCWLIAIDDIIDVKSMPGKETRTSRQTVWNRISSKFSQLWQTEVYSGRFH